jgi:hypothetical protein
MCIAVLGILVGVSTGNNNAGTVDAASKAVELSGDAIYYNSFFSMCMQIPSEDNGGIYFLNENELSFYNLDEGKVTKKETLLYNDSDLGYTSMEDAYLCGNKLYVLLDGSDSGTELVIYDLKNQCVSDREILTVSASIIAVDSSGRILLASGKNMYLLSAKYEILDTYEAANDVADLVGFDSTGKIYVQCFVNWVYWGFDHDMYAMFSGQVNNNKISVNNDYNLLIAQYGWYNRQTQAEIMGNKYLFVDNTFNNELQVFDKSKYYSNDDVSNSEVFALYRDNTTESGGFDQEAAVGTRAVYLADKGTVVTITNDKTLVEYGLSNNKKYGSVTTTYPVFSLMKYNIQIIALYKNDSKFYLERFDWNHGTKITVSGATSIKVGSSTALTPSTDGKLTEQFYFSSSNSKIATVNNNGLVVGWKAGTVNITITTMGGLSKTVAVKVTSNSSIKNPSNNAYSLKGTVSDNISTNDYTVWSSVVNSYLAEESDGSLTRVEKVGKKIIVEKYSSDGKKLKSKKTLKMELAQFGGFFSGNKYNFLVFGKINAKESDKAEVMRVVKYSKSWVRLGSVSYKGCNTYEPFDSGSLRMTETNGSLYIYTCHTMYSEGDDIHHQANMIYVINESNLKKEQQDYDVFNIAQSGYVSHSFNQFIKTDGEYVYRVDHGDLYPRAISIVASAVGGDVTDVAYTLPISLSKVSGDNDTGASVGGFELSTDNCLIAANVVDYTKNASSSGVRNICISVTDKNFNSSKTVWFTKYKKGSKVVVRTPQLVKISDERFLLMWEEYNSSTNKTATAMVTVDGSGVATSDVVRKNVRLSDCQPIYCKDGNVKWYVTNNGNPCLYAVNPYLLSKVSVSRTSISKIKVSTIAPKTYTGKAITPAVTVTLKGKKLKKNVAYYVEYLNNTKPGKATIVIRGLGKYKGAVKKTFYIKPKTVSKVTLAKSGKAALKVKWQKNTLASGYQIVYSTDKKFVTGKKYVTVGKKTVTSKKISKLKSGKKYYVKIRAYKLVNGKKIYSNFSKVVAMKTK